MNRLRKIEFKKIFFIPIVFSIVALFLVFQFEQVNTVVKAVAKQSLNEKTKKAELEFKHISGLFQFRYPSDWFVYSGTNKNSSVSITNYDIQKETSTHEISKEKFKIDIVLAQNAKKVTIDEWINQNLAASNETNILEKTSVQSTKNSINDGHISRTIVQKDEESSEIRTLYIERGETIVIFSYKFNELFEKHAQEILNSFSIS